MERFETIFRGDFADEKEMMDLFNIDESDLKGADLLYANYNTGSYDGQALVIYIKDKVLYGVYGSHCSCYGLEDQWVPEETPLELLERREMMSLEDKKAIKEYMSSLTDLKVSERLC